MITAYHAHIYYDDNSFEKAEALIQKASKFDYIKIGRMHRKNVGPHPRQSCQLMFDVNQLNNVLPWLNMNRDDLTIFMHGLSGDDFRDHTDYAIWMGEMLELKLEMFK